MVQPLNDVKGSGQGMMDGWSMISLTRGRPESQDSLRMPQVEKLLRAMEKMVAMMDFPRILTLDGKAM